MPEHSSSSHATPTRLEWAVGIIVAVIGVTWQYASLNWIERFVSVFPSVPDVLMNNLPFVEFGVAGEVFFFAVILCFIIPHFRYNWRQTPRVLATLGLFYFVRGLFTFFLPIGSPVGAVSAAARLNVWGYASHAYFPGGHIGVLTTLALFQPVKRLRPVMWIGVVLFGVGTLLSKNHYTADSVAGVIIAYAVFVWVKHRWRIYESTNITNP